MSRITERKRRVNGATSYGPWFRLYLADLSSAKIQRLSPPVFKAWINLCCIAASRGGKLPDIEQIAFDLRISEHEADVFINALITARLVEQSIGGDNSLSMVGWDIRQYAADASAQRMRKLRAERRATSDDQAPDCDSHGSGDASVTSQVTTCASSTSTSSSRLPSQEKYSEVITRAGVHVGTRNAYARAKAGEGSV